MNKSTHFLGQPKHQRASLYYGLYYNYTIMKTLTFEQMEQVSGGFSGCDVAAYLTGASLTYVLTGIGTAICPGWGTAAGWFLGGWASLTIAYECE